MIVIYGHINPPLWGHYYESEFEEGKKTFEKCYIKCVICGKEKIMVDLEK